MLFCAVIHFYFISLFNKEIYNISLTPINRIKYFLWMIYLSLLFLYFKIDLKSGLAVLF